MTPPPRPAPSHVPTLTEVIELPGEPLAVPMTEAVPVAPVMAPVPAPQPMPVPALQPLPMPAPQPVPEIKPAHAPPIDSALPQPQPTAAVQAPAPMTAAVQPPPPVPATVPQRSPVGVDEAAMAQRVLAEVQRQIDGMLEYRLREALTPILARTSESLVRELRQELSKTMRDVVSRAVAQEVARQRGRS